MKKKKLLKRIEELEVLNTKLENKYKHSLYIDDRFTILMMRLLYENEKNIEDLLLKAYSSGFNTFTPLTHPIYHPDHIFFKKYCKEYKLEQELTPASEVISLDDNIFDIKVRPRTEVKRFSNLVDRI